METRLSSLSDLSSQTFDVLVVGGGINGAVCAAELSNRGASVALIDARDFAGFTSQHSSNLVWGGIKYMEGYEFGLVNGLCRSRNELMRSFPSVVKEIRFLTSVSSRFKIKRLVFWIGAWVYWLFGRAHTRAPKLVSNVALKKIESGLNVNNTCGGVEYSDAYLFDNDARFVFNFVKKAQAAGCTALNYVASTGAQQTSNGDWIVDAHDVVSKQNLKIRCRALINAAGAFADAHNEMSGVRTEHRHALSKGVHLLVPRISETGKVLAFFADDGRLFFAIPMASKTCIGTTDTRVDHADVSVSEEDREFILRNINNALDLKSPITQSDVIAERCGVRPLAVKAGVADNGDFLQLSRKHVVELDAEKRHLTIFGGKLTDCLNVAQEVASEVASLGIALTPEFNWFSEKSGEEKESLLKRGRSLSLDSTCSQDTGEVFLNRLWRRYGQNAHTILDSIEQDPAGLEEVFAGGGLRWCEIDYMSRGEMIVELEDLLRRRSKVALVIDMSNPERLRELKAVCDRIFGADAAAKLEKFLQSSRDSQG
ncbi:MAG: FAD-dependent oxidoreductase [Pseudomonadota bacterium]